LSYKHSDLKTIISITFGAAAAAMLMMPNHFCKNFLYNTQPYANCNNS